MVAALEGGDLRDDDPGGCGWCEGYQDGFNAVDRIGSNVELLGGLEYTAGARAGRIEALRAREDVDVE